MDTDIEQVTTLLFAQRLRRYSEAFEARSETDEVSGTSSMARGTQLASLGRGLEAHCARVLADYIALLELFDALVDSDELRVSFDRHVDDAVCRLQTRFHVAGKKERNRMLNLASAIKLKAATELARAVEHAETARRRFAKQESGRFELDDRLPLGRRGAFDRELALTAETAKREDGALALVMMDIDHFKSVNDEHGHSVGDEVLLGLARLVVDRVAHKARAYRFGGEEFALLLPSYSTEEAFGLAERVRKDIDRSVVSSKELHITSSFGVASIPDDASDAAGLLERADAALYRAKRAGRNRVGIPEP